MRGNFERQTEDCLTSTVMQGMCLVSSPTAIAFPVCRLIFLIYIMFFIGYGAAPLPTLGRCPLLKCVAGERACIFTSSLSFEAKVPAPYGYSVGDNLVMHSMD